MLWEAAYSEKEPDQTHYPTLETETALGTHCLAIFSHAQQVPEAKPSIHLSHNDTKLPSDFDRGKLRVGQTRNFLIQRSDKAAPRASTYQT